MFDSKGDTDIEHLVARSEAHDSGLCRADAATRRAFSRDLLNLTLASPRVNRQKGAKDAAEWQPDTNQCWFAQTVVDVRRAYRLTIDRREAAALDRILVGCSSTEMAILVLGPPVQAQDKPLAQELVADLRARAEAGDTEAQYNLGLRYATGKKPRGHLRLTGGVTSTRTLTANSSRSRSRAPSAAPRPRQSQDSVPDGTSRPSIPRHGRHRRGPVPRRVLPATQGLSPSTRIVAR